MLLTLFSMLLGIILCLLVIVINKYKLLIIKEYIL